MKITIEATSKEIAEFVRELQFPKSYVSLTSGGSENIESQKPIFSAMGPQTIAISPSYKDEKKACYKPEQPKHCIVPPDDSKTTSNY